MTNCIIRTSLWKIPLLLFVILFRALYVECFVPFRQQISSISYNYISTQLSASAVSSKNTLAPDKPSPRDQNARRKTRILFQSAKQLEKQGKWREASDMYQHILQEDPRDSHSHLGYARLEARRDSKSLSSNTTARHAFLQGTMLCPDSVHLWQAWALYEQSCGDYERARTLLEQALTLDERNPYVCHAYGLMEKKLGNQHLAKELWERPLLERPTAALVCSLGELFISNNHLTEARALYIQHFVSLPSEREKTELYLAAAWLEEKYFHDMERAEELIEMALQQSPSSSRAHVALARLEGRVNRQSNQSARDATRKRLAETCINIDNNHKPKPTDGRMFNAWASVEVKSKRYDLARKIMQQGIERFPNDKDLLQAAGGVEERVGNYTGAKALYAASLSIEPSAPTVLALAMLEIRQPDNIPADLDRAKGLFEEALLLDPRHGPVYNAYGNMERRRGNSEEARRIYKQGVRADCNDPASVFHGFAQLELSLGNVDIARGILNEGLLQVENQARFMDSSRHERAVFLVHTLGMVELNTNRALDASIVFKEGVKKHGNCSQLLLGAALSEVKLGNEDRAREWFERAARADKRHAQAWQAWGVMEMRAGHHSAAKALFESGIKNSPRHGALYHAYGTLEGRMGNTENARVLFKAGLKKCPDHVSLYQGWASVEVRDGNLLRAKRLIGEALTRDKTHGSGWLIAADIEERQGNAGLVGLLLRRGIECAPFDPSLYRAYGEYLVRNGEIKEARDVLEKGLEINPTHAPLYHSLAELEARVCNLEGLANLNKRAAKIFSNNAMEPTASSSQVFGDRMRDQHRRALPDGERIGENEAMEGATTSFASIRQLEEEFLLFEEDESLGNSDF